MVIPLPRMRPALLTVVAEGAFCRLLAKQAPVRIRKSVTDTVPISIHAGPGTRDSRAGLFPFRRQRARTRSEASMPSQRRGGGDESPAAHGDCQGCSDGDDDRAVVHAVAGAGGAAARKSSCGSMRASCRGITVHFCFRRTGCNSSTTGRRTAATSTGFASRRIGQSMFVIHPSSRSCPSRSSRTSISWSRGGCRTTRTLRRQRSCRPLSLPRLRLRGRWRAFSDHRPAMRCGGATRAGPTSSGGGPGTS